MARLQAVLRSRQLVAHYRRLRLIVTAFQAQCRGALIRTELRSKRNTRERREAMIARTTAEQQALAALEDAIQDTDVSHPGIKNKSRNCFFRSTVALTFFNPIPRVAPQIGVISSRPSLRPFTPSPRMSHSHPKIWRVTNSPSLQPRISRDKLPQVTIGRRCGIRCSPTKTAEIKLRLWQCG